MFCGRHLLLARQRRANVAGSDGAVEEMTRIIAQIRQRWPRVHIILRADSGFANDELMGWCEANRVDYVFGLARNRRLEAALVDQLAEAKRSSTASGQPARVFRDFQYCTIDSWSRTRRVVGKAEHTLEGANPRFIVTSLKRSRSALDARAIYEQLYCARGEAENRIGEQFELFAEGAGSTRCRAKRPVSGVLLPSRQVMRCQASAGSCRPSRLIWTRRRALLARLAPARRRHRHVASALRLVARPAEWRTPDQIGQCLCSDPGAELAVVAVGRLRQCYQRHQAGRPRRADLPQ